MSESFNRWRQLGHLCCAWGVGMFVAAEKNQTEFRMVTLMDPLMHSLQKMWPHFVAVICLIFSKQTEHVCDFSGDGACRLIWA